MKVIGHPGYDDDSRYPEDEAMGWEGLAPPYRTIVIDPPWRFATTMPVTGNAPGRTKQTGRSTTRYATMSIDDIAALQIAALADPTGAHLYLWTTNTHLEHAWRIVRGWGFDPKNVLTWCKQPKGMIGFGVFSPASEFILFATRAPRSIQLARCERTWFEWPRKAHSEKPSEFYQLVEAVSPAPYVNLFARKARIGWDGWGDEYAGQLLEGSQSGHQEPDTQ